MLPFIAFALVILGSCLVLRAALYFLRVTRGIRSAGIVTQSYASRSPGGPNKSQTTHFSATISYHYEGVEYSIDPQVSTAGVLPHYQQGQEVCVVVDPRRPAHGLLFTGLEIFKWCVLIAGGCMTVAGGILLILALWGVIEFEQATPENR